MKSEPPYLGQKTYLTEIFGRETVTEEMSGRTKRVALVMGSGSLKCAAALGVREALQRADIGIDMVVGCSGGSQYATFIAGLRCRKGS